jgi:hypothetical protein
MEIPVNEYSKATAPAMVRLYVLPFEDWSTQTRKVLKNDLRVYDSNVSLAAVHGANRGYILNKIPHISRLMVPTIEEVLAVAGVERAQCPIGVHDHHRVID